MNTLIHYALKKPVSILMLVAMLIILGIFLGSDLEQEFIPNISIPSLVVISSYRSAGPKDVRVMLTEPLELALSSVENLKSIKSISRTGTSIIQLRFHWNTDMLMAGLSVRELIDRQYPSLPQAVSKPIVLDINPNERPIFILGIFPKEGQNLAATRYIAERDIRAELQRIAGVGSTIIKGGLKQELQVRVKQDLLASYGLSIAKLSENLEEQNLDYPLGNFNEGSLEYTLKTVAKVRSIEALATMPILLSKNTNEEQQDFVYLADLSSDISLENAEQYSFISDGKQEGVALIVRRQEAASISKTTLSLAARVLNLEQKYKDSFEFKILYDARDAVDEVLSSLFISILLSLLMAFLIVFFFLGSWQTALLILCSIPLSLLISIICMSISGISLNSISLAALSLSIGMLVDNSVVVLEYLERHSSLLIEPAHSKIKDPNNEAKLYSNRYYQKQLGALVRDIAKPSLGASLTSIIVFIPLIFLPNIIGSLYFDFSLTIAFALLASFFVSICIIPVFFLFLQSLSAASARRDLTKLSTWSRKLISLYKLALKRSFARPLSTAFTVLVFLLLGLVSIAMLPFELFSSDNSFNIVIELDSPVGSSISWRKDIAQSIVQSLDELNLDYENLYIENGGENRDTYFLANPDSSNEQIFLHLSFKKTRSSNKELLEFLKANILLRDTEIRIYETPSVLRGLFDLSRPKAFLLIARDTNAAWLDGLGETLAGLGLQAFNLRPYKLQRELSLLPKRQLLSQLDVSMSEIQNFVNIALEGQEAGTIDLGGIKYKIKILLDENPIDNIEKLESLKILARDSEQVLHLEQLVRSKFIESNSTLMHIDKSAAIIVDINDESFDLKHITRTLAKQAVELSSISSSIFRENAGGIIMVLLTALILLYLFLAMQFESFLEPLLLLLNMPVAILGTLISLWLANMSFNINSFLGILTLFGLSINNAIILKDQVSILLAEGRMLGPHMLYLALSLRIRPILITTFTTILALVPLAFLAGNPSQQNLALSIIGGLSSTTLFTIFILPQLLISSTKVVRA